jgi:hypothetical protein
LLPLSTRCGPGIIFVTSFFEASYVPIDLPGRIFEEGAEKELPNTWQQQEKGKNVGDEARHHQQNSRNPADRKGTGALVSDPPQKEAHREEQKDSRGPHSTSDVEEEEEFEQRQKKYKKNEGAEKSHRDDLGQSRILDEKSEMRNALDSGEIVNPVHTLIPQILRTTEE